MSFNKSVFAFEDIREAFERALAAPRGIKITCANRGAAIVLRSRFNYFRKLNRQENSQTYPSDHPMHNRSPYDRLVLRIPASSARDNHVLYIEHRLVGDMQIEDLGDQEGPGETP